MKNKITYLSKSKVVIDDDKKYIYKVRRDDKEELYKYLKSKNFLNFLPYTEKNNHYEIYRYIEDSKLPKEDKAIELIYILSLLHTKTTIYQDINIDKIKELYEQTKEHINYLKTYYLDLQDYIETKIFMSPAEYLLMQNISKFYRALNYSDYKIDEWYALKEKEKTERIVQLHNNATLDHFLKEENSYLINWDYAKKDYVIYDFLKFYKNEYLDLEMTSLFDLYQTKYEYTKDELLLFESFISIMPKITFSKTNYINTLEVRTIINYVDKTNEFLSKYYEKNQKSNEEEFK